MAKVGSVAGTLLERFKRMVWGYDFFISYHWKSGGEYAVALAEALRTRDFDCFLDRSEFAAGDDWKGEAGTALDSTERLIVVGTREAISSSPPVEHEIETFRKFGRRIILIHCNQSAECDIDTRQKALTLVGESTLIIEDAGSGNNQPRSTQPSRTVLDRIEGTHHVLRRRSRRTRIVSAVILTLFAFLVATTASTIMARRATKEEDKARRLERAQRLLATAGEETSRASLLLELEGMRLMDSLVLAVSAYRTAYSNEVDVLEDKSVVTSVRTRAEEAIKAVLSIMPEPLEGPVVVLPRIRAKIEAIDEATVVVTPRGGRGDQSDSEPWIEDADPEPSSDELPLAVTVHLKGRALTTVSYEPKVYGERLEETHVGSPRWLCVRKPTGDVHIVDLVTGQYRATFLPGTELAAVSANGKVAITREREDAIAWNLDTTPPTRQPLGLGKLASESLADIWLSPTGQWVVWSPPHAQQLHIIAYKTSPRRKLEVNIAPGGGHLEGVRFTMERDSEGEIWDSSAVAWWSANQVAAATPGTGAMDPSWQGQVYQLRSSMAYESDDVPRALPLLARAKAFMLVPADSMRPTVAVLDAENATQLIEVDSQTAFTLPGRSEATAAWSGVFSPSTLLHGCDKHKLPCLFAATHLDKTARVWDLARHKELLRLTSREAITGVALLSGSVTRRSSSLRAIITRDKAGVVQAWKPERWSVTLEDLVTGRVKIPDASTLAL